MQSLTIVVLDGSPLIARDVHDEVLQLCPGARIEIAPTLDAARRHVGQNGPVDLMIVSDRGSATLAPDEELAALADAARAVLIIGHDAGELSGRSNVFTARAPFTSVSLSEDLRAISLSGEPLFLP